MRRFFFSLPGAVAALGVLVLVLQPFLGVGFAIGATEIRSIMQVVISLIVLGAALYVILSKRYDVDAEKWAFGIIGTVVGYWLPTP